MNFTNLQRQWQFAADQLGLLVQAPYVIQFKDGSQVEVEVRLQGYGAKNGMLVLSDYRKIEEKKEEIMAAGYGYSCYGPVPESEVTSLEGFAEMLSDWGKLNPSDTEPNQALQHNDPGCHVSCLRTPRASRGRG